MLRTRHITTLLTLLALALPASAAAQGSAGSDQYQDPFGNSGGSTHNGSRGSGSSRAPSASSSGTGTGSTSSISSSSTATTGNSSRNKAEAAASPASGSAPGELPRTGMDVWFEALGGAVLVAAGLRLRARSVA